ncbi:MAG: chromosome segregation ATPase [Candidatus Magnetoglobus multicellularis str. Araruama]|uniref:Chromosome segregation ATPase n=1 Tax=Candidatus Magnetoglobus multicellularis str. Araruama TaxID=890399 RepID=A0A1V1NY54_9BACT|nr:MAG: chromosome segregation ATPase [Candidatus Magnetoglobus multicellularis str. Araruama]
MGCIMNYKETYFKLVGEKNALQRELKMKESNLEHLQNVSHWVVDAQMWLQKVALDEQNDIKFNIENIVNMALSTVFDDPYTFHIEFNIKHNKTEATLFLEKWNKRFNPAKDNGGGVVDIVSFALRIAMFKIHTPQLGNTMILDEPFKWISEEYKERAFTLLKNISEKLELQFIVVTHDTELKEYADTMYRIIKRGESSIARKVI